MLFVLQKPENTLHVSHSHYQLLSRGSDTHATLLLACTPPCAATDEDARGFLHTQTLFISQI